MRTRRSAVAATVAAAILATTACTSKPPAAPIATPPGSLAASGTAPMPTGFAAGAASAGDVLFPDGGDGGYDATHYDLSISYDPASTQLTGHDVVTATATQNLSRFDLDLHGLTVATVEVNGTAAAFARTADKLVVTPAAGIATGSTFTTDVTYQGTPTPYIDPTLGFEGFVPAPNGGHGALAQGEPDVAASWYPVDDHPRDKATYDVTISVPDALAAISNGVLVSKTPSGTETAWHWRESAPMASYLVLVAIGNYRIHTSSHDGLPVFTAVDATLPTSYDTQLDRTPEIVDFLSTYFGPYPFDAIGGVIHNDNRLGFALENQTRPAYAPGFFRTGDGTGVIAHELAHQWFGDSVSLTQWRDMWLNESFARYAEWLWTEHQGGNTPKQTFDNMYAGTGPTALPDDPPGSPDARTLFGNSVYDRGAATLEALRITIGDPAFLTILRGWPIAHRFGNATTAQFIAYAEKISGHDLGALFTAWLYTPGKPPYPTPMS